MLKHFKGVTVWRLSAWIAWMTTELYARLVMVSQSERYTELYARPMQTTCRPHLMFSGSAAGSKAHSEHRFPAPSSKLCQIWLRH